jgi:hypothetical protein
MLAAVTALNRQITELAPVLNSPTLTTSATVKPENPEAPVALMVKRHAGSTYLFAVGMRNLATTAELKLPGAKGEAAIEILGENRKLTARDGAFSDRFEPWDAHIYRLKTID